MQRKFYLITAIALSAVAVTSVYAARSADNDALAISGAKIGLSQAVNAAEQHVGGKASRAEFERHHGQWVFDVEVIKDAKVMDVKVDPASAAIIAAVEDKKDHDDEHDKAD